MKAGRSLIWLPHVLVALFCFGDGVSAQEVTSGYKRLHHDISDAVKSLPIGRDASRHLAQSDSVIPGILTETTDDSASSEAGCPSTELTGEESVEEIEERIDTTEACIESLVKSLSEKIRWLPQIDRRDPYSGILDDSISERDRTELINAINTWNSGYLYLDPPVLSSFSEGSKLSLSPFTYSLYYFISYSNNTRSINSEAIEIVSNIQNEILNLAQLWKENGDKSYSIEEFEKAKTDFQTALRALRWHSYVGREKSLISHDSSQSYIYIGQSRNRSTLGFVYQLSVSLSLLSEKVDVSEALSESISMLDNSIRSFYRSSPNLYEESQGGTLSTRDSLYEAILNVSDNVAPFEFLQSYYIQKKDYGNALELSELRRSYRLDKWIDEGVFLPSRRESSRRGPQEEPTFWISVNGCSSRSPSCGSFLQTYSDTSINADDLQRIAQEKDLTIVIYSTPDNLQNISEEIRIWVVTPDGEIDFFSQDNADLVERIRAYTVESEYGLDRGDDFLLAEATRNFHFSIERELSLSNNRSEASNLDSVDSSNEENTDSAVLLKEFYQALIEPIEDYLPESVGEKVVFIPDNELFFLPFAAFQRKDNQYLIDQYSVMVAPNVKTLIAQNSSGSANFAAEKNKILLVGNPEEAELPGTLFEVDGIERIIQDLEIFERFGLERKSLVNNQARLNTVRSGMEEATIIHFATHGSISLTSSESETFEGIPGELVLSNSERLRANDIHRLNLNGTGLVVLSACSTGQGEVIPGGITGLPLAFNLAGASNVMVSLWPVSDIRTRFFMEEFYQEFFQQLDTVEEVDIASALREAMLKTKADPRYSHPRYWAPFVLYGPGTWKPQLN